MVENQRNLYRFPNIDNAIFQPSKIKSKSKVLLVWFRSKIVGKNGYMYTF